MCMYICTCVHACACVRVLTMQGSVSTNDQLPFSTVPHLAYHALIVPSSVKLGRMVRLYAVEEYLRLTSVPDAWSPVLFTSTLSCLMHCQRWAGASCLSEGATALDSIFLSLLSH